MDKIISIYWFTVLFLITGAIVYMVAIFYGEPFDVRDAESHLLNVQIADCFSRGGYLPQVIFDGENFLINRENLLDTCKLSFVTEDFSNWNEQGQYYLEVEILDFDTKSPFELPPPIRIGNFNLRELCNLGKRFPKCESQKIYVLDKNNFPYQINILSAVRKVEKNVI